MGQFSCYLGIDDTEKVIETDLKAINTGFIPSIPIRRIGCKACLQGYLRCEDCRSCHKADVKKQCCRGLGCIFDYASLINHKLSDDKLACKCYKRYHFSNDAFDIDWRLLNLLIKYEKIIGYKKALKLSFHGGLL